MNDIYKNIEEYNPNKKHKLLIVFDDVIADMPYNENLNPIVTELFIRQRKLNISYFSHYFTMKIPNKLELQKIAFNHSSNVDF